MFFTPILCPTYKIWGVSWPICIFKNMDLRKHLSSLWGNLGSLVQTVNNMSTSLWSGFQTAIFPITSQTHLNFFIMDLLPYDAYISANNPSIIVWQHDQRASRYITFRWEYLAPSLLVNGASEIIWRCNFHIYRWYLGLHSGCQIQLHWKTKWS